MSSTPSRLPWSLLLATTLVTTMARVPSLHAADWPQWRGPKRNGHSADTDIVRSWPDGGPPLVWSADTIGKGYSSVAVADGSIFTMGERDGASWIVVLAEADAAPLWTARAGKAGSPGGFAGPRATPTVDGDLVFAASQMGEIVCVEAATGRERWRRHLIEDLGGGRPGWGYTASPLVVGELVVTVPGGERGTLAALDRKTGETRWRSGGLTDGAAYDSPVECTIHGVEQVVYLTPASIAGVALETGEVLWRAPRRGETAVIPDPIVVGDLVYVTSGYGVGCNLFRVLREGGGFDAEEVYSNKIMTNHHGGVVRLGEHLYGYSDGKGWVCQEIATGAMVWNEKRKLGKGCVTFADGRLVLRAEGGPGTVALIEATPEGYVETGRFNPSNRSDKNSWPHPVVANGRLYLRDQDVLVCHDVGAPRTAGLEPRRFVPLAPGSIRPLGWLRSQLRIQAEGLTGNLDEFWPDVRDSGWIGGQAEGWERAPYWLDGLVPLAHLLDDPELKEKVKRYVDHTLEHQDDDGWLGPEKSATGNYKPRDPWPVYVMMKVLMQHHAATGDERIIPAVGRFLRALQTQLARRPLFSWNRMRWQDGVLGIQWLHDHTGEEWLLDLGATMHRQGYDWRAHFANLPHRDKVARWEHESHVVNNAMGVKAAAVWYRQSGDPADAVAALEAPSVLDRYHGQATGVFTGDECFAGKMPSQGTETCAVVEYLYSLEEMISILGEPALGDRLERVAFNALPAPFKPDMWARQYVQQANQAVARTAEERIYTTNGPKANVFGLETNYGCCTANMHQGWPKFATHLWMAVPGGGLAAVAYAPSSVSTTIDGARVEVALETDYPFRETLEIEVRVDRPVEFPLILRIPGWAMSPTLRIEGADQIAVAPGTFHRLERLWRGTERLRMVFPMPILAQRRYNGAVSLARGPVVLSLEIGQEWRQIAGEPPHADWEVHPTSPWNYALALDPGHPGASLKVELSAVGENPFAPEQAPLRARVQGRRLPAWGLERNAAAPPPRSPVTSNEALETLTLIPYGAAKLRVTEFPVLD